jgi:hypothetical protein
MELSVPCEAESCYVTEAIPSIHKKPPLVSIQSQINPFYISPSNISRISFSIILIRNPSFLSTVL